MFSCKFNFLRAVPVIAMLTFSIPTLNAAAINPNSTFYFTGACSDCAGTANATLVLSNYSQGSSILLSNLVSFNYTGTNLVNPFTFTQADVGFFNFIISGTIPVTLPSATNFSIGFQTLGRPTPAAVKTNGSTLGNPFFNTASNGVWSVAGSGILLDFGTVGGFSGSPTPEPASFVLVAAGIAALALRRRTVSE